MIEICPIHHSSSQGHTPITVDDDDEGGVDIAFHSEPGGTELRLTRTLTPGEARALAAMLVHYSFEAEL